MDEVEAGFVALADLLRGAAPTPGGAPRPPAPEPPHDPLPAPTPPSAELATLVRELRLLRAQLVDALESAR